MGTPATHDELNSALGETPSPTDIELALLSALSRSDEPVGAVALSFELKGPLRLSQATIGRKLKEFDVRGLTERVSFQGRRLTKKGDEHLRKLVDAAGQARRNEAFLRRLAEADGELLVQVLEARRALETEIVRLATERMADAELDQLQDLIERQRQAVKRGESGAYENVAFHEMLAQCSRNQVLADTLRLVRSQSKLILLTDVMRTQVGGMVVRDHEEILAAMRKRDPDGASRVMARHLDRLIEDIRAYLSGKHALVAGSEATVDSL